jgi:hypothetical protein
MLQSAWQKIIHDLRLQNFDVPKHQISDLGYNGTHAPLEQVARDVIVKMAEQQFQHEVQMESTSIEAGKKKQPLSLFHAVSRVLAQHEPLAVSGGARGSPAADHVPDKITIASIDSQQLPGQVEP